VSFHSLDDALNSDDVVALLKHRRREVPGRMVIIWDGSPIHRRHVIQAFLANGAAQRIHLKRLPADAPDLNAAEGLWAPLNGVKLRHVCGDPLPHLRGELCNAVKQLRRKPRLIQGCFKGAGL
jgi:transposase